MTKIEIEGDGNNVAVGEGNIQNTGDEGNAKRGGLTINVQRVAITIFSLILIGGLSFWFLFN